MKSNFQTQKTIAEDNIDSPLNIIKQTRKIIKNMTQQQRIHKAIGHVNDALFFRHPRPDIHNSTQSNLFNIVYTWQTSNFWSWFLFMLTYIYFYLIAIDHKIYYNLLLGSQISILLIYWLDIGLYLYHKSFETKKISSGQQTRLYIKIIVLIILIADLLVFAITTPSVKDPYDNIRYFSPFRFIRGLLPILYDAITRKSVMAFLSTYKNMLICALLYMVVIFAVTLISNQFLQFPQDWVYDQYKQNYPSFTRSIIIVYVIASYEAYPQNQYAAVRWSQWIYLLWHLFVLLNMFFIGNIPGPLIYNSFRQSRSKSMLMDQIRQQHSLILAFVSLANDNHSIDNKMMIKFLLALYRYKVRYVNYIADIYLIMDDNNNGSIQINEFMQLTKIVTKHSHMFPPQFQDFQPWINFRAYINENFKLKQIVKSWLYRFITNFMIIVAFINGVVFIQTKIPELDNFDNAILAFFIVDIILRIIGLGVQTFFNDKWNYLDFVLVAMSFILTVVGQPNRPIHSDKLFKMMRIFRIATLIKLVFYKGQSKKILSDNLSMYDRLRRLLGYTMVTILIILKFFPLFLLLFYYGSLVGMQLFYQAEKQPPTQMYGMYAEYSHFKQFVNSQYIMFQILLQADWSSPIYDLAARSRMYWPTIIYFIVFHLLIVVIMAPLFKALLWQAYSNIQSQFQQNRTQQIEINLKQIQNQKKKQQFTEIRLIIEENGFIIPNTVVKRQFLQNKLDKQILKRLKQLYFKKSYIFKSPQKKQKRSGVIQQIVLDKKKYLVQDFSDNQQQNIQDSQAMNRLYQKIIRQNLRQNSLQNVQKQDFQQQMQQLMEKLILHPKTKYNQTIVYPKPLLQLLQLKMKNPFTLPQDNSKFNLNLNKNILRNKQSINYHIAQLNVLLGIEKSQKDQKAKVVKYMIQNNLITEQQGKNLISKQDFQKNKNMNSNWIIRKMFLGKTDKDALNKLEIQYFSNIYGRSYVDINKLTIEPLLIYQADLIHNLKNILRYPQIITQSFFQLFTVIQDKITNQLLKKGSLFKFIYQIQSFSDNWFTVQLKGNEDMRIHFIKTGIWIYNKTMEQNQIYYGKDLFNWNVQNRQDRITCEKILKLLYQTFQGLAFGLLNQKNFFLTNPTQCRYDLYSFFINVDNLQRTLQRKLQISKIMLVILSKQQQRQQQKKLGYQLTQIISQKEQKQDLNFKLEQTQKQTFQKLNNFSGQIQQKIIDNQGLPYAYILNLMKQMKDIVNLFKGSLTNHVEKVFNDQFFKDMI